MNLGSSDTFRFQVVYGEGIENYMNDATVDIGIVDNPGDPVTPVKGEALPLLGIVAFLDHNWNDQFSSSIGYSMLNIDNTPQQNADAFETGHYAVGNLLYHPVNNVTIGGELQYGKRENARDGFTSDDFKVQILVQVRLLEKFRRIPMRISRLGALVAGLALVAGSYTAPLTAQTPQEIQAAVDAAYAKYKNLQEGANADYIPALAKVDPDLYGIAVVTADGKVYTAGDVENRGLDSVDLEGVHDGARDGAVRTGSDRQHDRGGRDGRTLQLDRQHRAGEQGLRRCRDERARQSGRDRGHQHGQGIEPGRGLEQHPLLLLGVRGACRSRCSTDVYESEAATNQRNQAIGALMLAYGYIEDNWEQAVDVYTEQCSVGVNAKDLATMAGTLASGGAEPRHRAAGAASPDYVDEVLAVMATAGLYDDSGKWLFRTGLPGKSGVGGGLIAVSPGKFGIAVVSPPLDEAGNSVRAQKAITDISNALGGNPYAVR